MRSTFFKFARPYASRYVSGFVLLLATNALSLWIPWLLRDAIRAMERGAALRTVAELALAMVGVGLMQAVVRTISRRMILGASRYIVHDIRQAFFAHLQRLGPGFYDTQRTGDIMSRGVNDVRLIQGFFGPGVLNLLNTAIVYVAVLILLLRIDATLTLVSVVLYPILFVGVNRVSRRVYARSLAVQEQLATISNRVQENISGIQQVKIFAQEDREIEAFRELCDEFRRRNMAMATLRGGMLSLIGIISGLGTLVVLFVGGKFVIEGRMELGDFVAFNAYLGLLVWPTIALGWIINTLQRGAGAMGRIEEILLRRPDSTGADPGSEDADPVDGDLEIRRLTFHYPRSKDEDDRGGPRAVLEDVSLEIPRGSRVAVVGPVGSGKSTLANLIARLYPVPPKTVFIGGTDVNDFPLRRLRGSIGYVPQEAFLFSRSLRENIALGEPDASPQELAEVVELAHLEGDIAAFPHGLETRVGERGFTLSGGQRQRATLARAVLGNRPFLILDDSLSSVDADTERAILEAIQDRRSDRTLILISHRLSTLAGMDRIFVMDSGRLVESGTHEELVRSGGLYTEMFRRRELEQRLEGS